MIKLGVLHAEGDFDTQDKVNAIQWFQQAADLYDAHKMYSSVPCDDEEIQQAKEQFIELTRQADEVSETIIITRLGIHWFDGVEIGEDNRMIVIAHRQAVYISEAYAIIHLGLSLMKKKSAGQDTNPTQLIQQVHAIQKCVEKITKCFVYSGVKQMAIFLWGIQVVPEFPQRLCRIALTVAKFMLEQLKKEQH